MSELALLCCVIVVCCVACLVIPVRILIDLGRECDDLDLKGKC